MAESRRYALDGQLDIAEILKEAEHRWLRPVEICEILKNYQNFQIAPEPPNRPPNGSLFLFDRKVLRYFRKDGHNWRKKKDGKTVKEAHERLKAGSIDVLHCYYAHGEDNENFQRRSYWMLEEELSHIVLVHYLEVKGSRTNFNRIREAESAPNRQATEDNISTPEVDASKSSKFQPYDYRVTSQLTDTTSLNSAQSSEYEDAESVYSHQPNSSFQSFVASQPPVTQKMEDGSVPHYPVPFSDNYQGQFQAIPDNRFQSITMGNKNNLTENGLTYELHQEPNFSSWHNALESNMAGYQFNNILQSLPSTEPSSMTVTLRQENGIRGQDTTGAFSEQQDRRSHTAGVEGWQVINGGAESPLKLESERRFNVEDEAKYSSARQPLLDGVVKEGLRKLDSFDRWMTKELGDVTEPPSQSSSEVYWDTVGNEDGVDSSIAPQVSLDSYVLGPSLSQDQLFSILDFSPSWAYAGSEIKVLITGRFLRSQQEIENHKWACMFGELEIPAEIIADGVLRCYTPAHKTGRVPFYITRSNRLACSEVREFEFRAYTVQDTDYVDANISSDESLLHMRFVKLLSLDLGPSEASVPSNAAETSNFSSKIRALLKDDGTDWEQMLNLTYQNDFSVDKVRDQLLQKLLKDKLHIWLVQKVTEGGKGPNVFDEDGQGVLHLAAALGYDWAIPPTVAAGVSINFRDANGWTALHWAAYYGRERTVAFLISSGAAPGALTDPSPKYPSGRAPADIASSRGHKGIAGYLAESALSYHLVTLKLKETKKSDVREISGVEAIETVSERTATPVSDGDLQQGLSLKDSLAAVRNATQAAARIHEVFRVRSFQRKQLEEYGDGELSMSDERALSLVAMKTGKRGLHDEPVHAAAIRIQNKFRSWKGRKEFLLIRERVIKIQAHVRGHQVRKNYKKIIWSVGILDKVILRWKRKGKGLSGFKPEAPTEGTSMQDTESKEDDYDFLREGRKQTEERSQKALARVKSMLRYPEARDQYRRLLNVVSEIQERKAAEDRAMEFDNELLDLEALLEDDTFMPDV